MSNIVVPQLGESVVEARVTKWLKKPGDRVQVGEPLVELETEKIDVEVPADSAGVLTSIAHQEGDDVKVGDVLAVVDETASDSPADSASAQTEKPAPALPPAADASAPAATAPVAQPAAKAAKPTEGAAPAVAPAQESPRATPTARRIAEDQRVDLGSVQGSGSAGRVMKQDVIEKGSRDSKQGRERPQPVTPNPTGTRPEERVRMSKRRATIARRLVEAQRTAAMLTTFNEVDMTAVMATRARHKETFKERFGVGLGLTSFFVKAAIAALRAFPRVNAEIQGDEVVLKQYYDIGIAVGAEGGLVVPVLRDADRMSFGEIERTVRDVAARANDGSLTLADLTGGTFTITNGGVFGSLMSTPILNPPQVGILGLHKIVDRPVAVDGQVVIRPMMYLALSYDHRLVDGREAVQFLVRVKEFIEDPGYLLLEG